MRSLWELITANVWYYKIVLMFYSTCYLLVRIISTKLESNNKDFFFSFLCGGKILKDGYRNR